jgi:membrane-bound lytic murein transglycosylase A
MRARREFARFLVVLAVAAAAAGLAMPADADPAAASPPPLPEGTVAEPVAFEELPGWAADDHLAAFTTWLVSCRTDGAALRPARPAEARLAATCRDGLAAEVGTAQAARDFFEAHFAAWRIRPPSGEGFFTGYYEPEIDGSLDPVGPFRTPLLDRPPDLVTLAPNEVPEALAGLTAARRRPDGGLEAYPDRAAIEGGALDGLGLERAYVADPVDRFFMQVQGSGRLRLGDGRVLRFAYAGRNGHPYTAIGRIVADREGIPRPQMTMDVLRAFLARDAEVARQVMQENKSFVFFRLAEELDPALGPIGGEGVPLTPRRSLAVDRSIWSYGLPVFVDLPLSGPRGPEPFQRLMIAQDTGSAIVGPARGDIFIGSGAEAGRVAGSLRQTGGFTVLWPRPRP